MAQKCAIDKEYAIFISSSWHSTKITYPWANHFSEISDWLEENCRFFSNSIFLSQSYFSLLILYVQNKPIVSLCMKQFGFFSRLYFATWKCCHAFAHYVFLNLILHFSNEVLYEVLSPGVSKFSEVKVFDFQLNRSFWNFWLWLLVILIPHEINCIQYLIWKSNIWLRNTLWTSPSEFWKSDIFCKR